MQISASTLQAQQTARVAPKASPAADAATFAPLNFKQAAKAPAVPTVEATVPAPQTQQAAAPSGGYVRPGTHIDIKI